MPSAKSLLSRPNPGGRRLPALQEFLRLVRIAGSGHCAGQILLMGLDGAGSASFTALATSAIVRFATAAQVPSLPHPTLTS
jgi:hypothetical protein